MDVSKALVEKVLKTLPIGYYIKRGLNVSLHDGPSSYYDMTGDAISISYPQIYTALKSLENELEIEGAIRAMLYHETSHAFLTPKKLKVTDLVNIFEDERIESLLRTYYERVNFRKFVKLINNYDGKPATCAKTAFYHIVRYREGPNELVEQVIKIIADYAQLNRNSGYCTYYEQEIHDFFIRVKEWFDAEASESENAREATAERDDGTETTSDDMFDENSSNTSERSDKSEESDDWFDPTDCDDSDDADETDTVGSSRTRKSGTSDERDDVEDVSDIDDELELNELIDGLSKEEKEICETGSSTMEHIINHSFDEKYISDVSRIFGNAKKLDSHNGSAINAYSGVFNARSVVRNDYKFFVQQNRSGNAKAFAKMHLNLFIDSSGSFKGSEKTVNKLLNALTKYEKMNSNFSFDLVTCGMGQKLHKRHERELYCTGGNDLTPSIFEIFKKLQYKQSSNINIVLFDGDAYSDTSRFAKHDTFKAFDTANSTIISCDDNVSYISAYVKTAKVIYTHKYVEELYDHVIKSLEILVR